MKKIAVLSGDKRQASACRYLKENGYDAYLKNNMDFHDDDVILCGTPLLKNGEYLNCDFHSAFPAETFLGLLRKNQYVFAGAIPQEIRTSAQEKGLQLFDLLDVPLLVWNNAYLTAEALVGKIITDTDFSLRKAKVLIIGFGRCGMNLAALLKSFGAEIFVYDHTEVNLARAASFGCRIAEYEQLDTLLPEFRLIINTVPKKILTLKHYQKISRQCVLYDISSSPYGFSKDTASENHLSLYTCPGLPGKYTPQAAGEFIARTIISYMERKK